MSDNTTLMQAMSEYAQAIRGDWSDFDGRSERDVIESWVSAMKGERPYADWTLDQWRTDLGLCPDGGGHWGGRWGHCEMYKCPTFVGSAP